MPWPVERDVAQKRLEFIKMIEDGRYSMVELCEMFGIARSNAYKWLHRYFEGGLEGLKDLRRSPHSSPLKTPSEIEELIVQERDRHATWGPRKLLVVLSRDYPDIASWPAASTVYDILKRHGRVQSVRRRRRHEHPGKPFVLSELPNSVWSADFKGQFRLGNGRLCYPLTVADGCSRFLLGCEALTSPSHALAYRVFRGLFEEYGLPEAMLTDNGTPFASTGLGGLSQLSVWWLRLGIRPVRTQPSHPEQNGRHERMHRTLKAEATRPAEQTHRAQQRAFLRFRHEYNDLRPHEGIGQQVPSSLYAPSPRRYPKRLPPVEYPGTFVTRLVSDNGSIRWNAAQIFVTTALAGQHIGLEEIDDGIWAVYFGTAQIGRLNARTGTVK